MQSEEAIKDVGQDVSFILNDEARQQGFTLLEPDDHILELRSQGTVIARFSQMGVEAGVFKPCGRCIKCGRIYYGWSLECHPQKCECGGDVELISKEVADAKET